MLAYGRIKAVVSWVSSKINIMGTLRRCAVLEILMYSVYIPVSVLRAPCTVSHHIDFSVVKI